MVRGIFAVLFLFAASNAYASCNGDACTVLQIKQVDDCIVLVNTHPANDLNVHLTELGLLWKVPAASEMTAMMPGGACLQDWPGGDFEATLVVATTSVDFPNPSVEYVALTQLLNCSSSAG